MSGHEYKTKTQLFGLPLVHVVKGRAPDGSRVPAVGIIAIGRKAFGAVAVGQYAMGIVVIAVFGIGLFGLGMIMASIFVIAQFGIGIAMGIGQFATGWYSIGQFALGYKGLSWQGGYHYIEENWLAGVVDFLAAKADWSLVGGALMPFLPIFIPLAAALIVIVSVRSLIFWGIRNFWLEAMTSAGFLKFEETTAVIESMDETGITVNNDPMVELQLKFRAQNGETVDAKTRTVISRLQTADYRPGTSIRIRYNPKKPTRVLSSLNQEKASISRERNVGVLTSVLEVFDPSLKPFLTAVPIVLDSSADTARAYPAEGCIGVSPDWDNTVFQSQYRAIYEQRGMKLEDPVFTLSFKTDLLIHEFLHMLQIRQGIDSLSCYEAVARWYTDPRYGIPSPNAMVHADMTKDQRPVALALNRMKYIVWHHLYNYRMLSDVPLDESWKDMQYGARYRLAEKGVEEFAYIGEEILSSGSNTDNYMKTGQWCDLDWKNKKMRLREVSPEVIALFRGVFNPELTR